MAGDERIARPPSVLQATAATESAGATARSTDTESLVNALNTRGQWIKEPGVRDWFQHCVRWFAEQPTHTLTASDIREYALLGKMKAECLLGKELWKSWFQSLCLKVEDSFAGKELIQCIYEALQSANIEALGEESKCLTRLADCMLGRIDKGGISVTKEMYPLHCLILFTVHQTFATSRKLAPRRLDFDDKEAMYRRFRRLLKNISEDRTHYPFRYQAKLIEQSLRSLKNDGADVSIVDERLRFFFSGYGTVAAIKEVNAVKHVDFDHEACETALKNARDALTAQQAFSIRHAPWFDGLLEVYRTSLGCIRDPNRFSEFEECCRQYGDKAAMMNREDRISFRFGLVDHLRMLSMHGTTTTIQSEALRMLVSLGKGSRCERSGWEGWAEDAEIFEALLDALYAVYPEVGNADAAAIAGALQCMTSDGARIDLRKKIEAWLDGRSLDDKLVDRPPMEQSSTSGTLFREATQRIAAIRQQKKLDDLRKELRVRYQLPEVALSNPLFEGWTSRHVRTLQLHLTGVDIAKNGDGPQETPQLASPQRKGQPLHFQDLFKSRKLAEEKHAQQIRKVLVVGNTGTGKTLLSRKIACHWSMGEWGSSFDAVYLLPVSQLTIRAYNGEDARREKTLPTAIANTCFSERADPSAFQDLCECIAHELKKDKTLVILDGLDANGEVCQEILEEAKNGQASLLAFGHPCNAEANRNWADVEVECHGFDEGQLMAFMNSELPGDKAKSLGQLLMTNDMLRKMACVPVNAHIFCQVWNEKPEILETERLAGTISSLYKNLANYMWDLFFQKREPKDFTRFEAFDALGALGFDALDQGQLSIKAERVCEHLSDPMMETLLKNGEFLLLQHNGVSYKFPHVSFQEYFAGCHLARKFYEGGSGAKKVANFIVKKKYNEEFQTVLAFMMEEVGRTQSCEGFKKILALVDTHQIEFFGFQHALLKLRLVESFLAVTKKRGLHETRFVDTTESVIKSVAEFMAPLAEMDGLRVSISKAFINVPNVRQVFPKYVKSLFGAFLEGDAPRPQRENVPMASQPTVFASSSSTNLAAMNTRHLATADVDYLTEVSVNKRTRLSASKGNARSRRDSISSVSSDHRKSVSSESRTGPSTSQGQNVLPRDQERLEKLTTCVLRLLNTVGSAEPMCPSGEGSKHPLGHIPSVVRCVDSLLEKMNVKDRPAFVQWIPQRIKEDPDCAAEFLRLHSVLLECRRAETCELALAQIPQLMELCPDNAGDLLALLSFQTISDQPGIRATAVRQLAAVVQTLPACANLVVNMLSQLREDTAPSALRSIAAEIPTLIALCRDRTQDILSFHSTLVHSSQINVCELAVKLIPKLIKMCPGDDTMLIVQLISQLKSPRFEIRAAAVDQILVTLKTSQAQSDRLMKAFLEVDWDGMGYHACMSVIKQMPMVAKAFPDHLTDLLRLQEDFLRMKDLKIRAATMDYVVSWIEGCPNNADALLEVFLRSHRSTSVDVRRKAMQQIPYLVKNCPWRRDELFRLQFRLLESEHPSTRAAAVSKISGWIRYLPANADVLVDILLRSYHDASALVRRQVVSQIMEIREIWPQQAEALNYLGWRACEDQDEGVRLAHVSQLFDALKKSSHQEEEHCIKQVARLLKDESASVRSALTAGFASLSLQTLVRLYLEENDTAVLRSIVPRLPHVALTVVRIKNKPDTKILTLQAGAWKRIQWERPADEIESVVLALRREIECSFPGVTRKEKRT